MSHTNEQDSVRREMQRFLYAVSHDLQEPFRKVQTFGRRLAGGLEGRLDDAARSDLERMIGAADRGQRMIEGLLVLSRIETHGGPMGRVELNSTIGQACEELEETITRSKAVVSIDSLPVVHGDADQLRLLFLHLLDNALKFCRPDTVPEIRVSAAPGDRPDFALIAVLDNGIGLDPQYADRVFTVFQRLHPRDVYPGLGLGLAYCAKIVARHGGTIGYDPGGDAGTRFVVTLPTRAT